MKIIIAGCGKVGSFIANYLVTEPNHDITVIDTNRNAVQYILDDNPITGITGSCTSIDILENAGIKNCDIFIATTNDDEVNMLSCQLASIYNIPTKIAMLDTIEYSSKKWQDVFIFKKIAIDRVISPKVDLINSIKQRLKYNHLNVSDLYDIADNKINVFSIFATKNNTIIGKSVEEIEQNALQEGLQLKIVFIVRNSMAFIPSGIEEIQSCDKIYISSPNKQLNSCYFWVTTTQQTEKDFTDYQNPSIVITGNHLFLKDLAIELKDEFNKIKVVSTSTNTEIPAELERHKIDYINDDITNTNYSHNYLGTNSTIIVLNNLDEETALTGIVLQHKKAGNLFCWLQENRYVKLLNKNGINHIFSPTNYIMPKILTNLRRGVIYSVFTLYNQAEIIDFELSENSKAIGLSIESIEQEELSKVIAVLNEDDEEIPFNHNTIVLKHYRVVLICSRKHISQIEKMFSQVIKT